MNTTLGLPAADATGVGITVRDFLEESFSRVELDWRDYVKFDERYLRPTEVDALVGDASKAEERLGWKATVDGRGLARLMVDADLDSIGYEAKPWHDVVELGSWRAA